MTSTKPSDPAYTKLKDLMMAGTLQAGQRVTQNELLHLLQQSLGPIRTALARLETEGFVRILPQRGIQIIEPTISAFRNGMQVRIALEKEAWSKFATTADDAMLAAMEEFHRDVLAKADQQITAELLEAATRYDHRMHDDVVAAMGNELLLGIFRVTCQRNVLLRSDGGRIVARTIKGTTQEHLAIIHACRERNPEAAARAVESHLMSAVYRFMKI